MYSSIYSVYYEGRKSHFTLLYFNYRKTKRDNKVWLSTNEVETGKKCM